MLLGSSKTLRILVLPVFLLHAFAFCRMIVSAAIAVEIVLALGIACVLSSMVLIYLMSPLKRKGLGTMILIITVLEG
jgi:hypothetical protein